MDRGKEYQRKKHVVSLVSLAVMLASLVFLIVTPVSILIREFAETMSANAWLIVAVYFTAVSLVLFLVDLPFTYYSGFHIEHAYGLSTLKIRGWVREMAKRQLIGFAFGFVLIELLYAIIRNWPDTWWIIAWMAWAFVSIVLSKLWPVYIAPLFYRYERLSDESLRTRILNLVGSVDLKIENVYSMNLSKTTNKANAFFQGLGSTRRVVLSDTLLRGFTQDEITVVVAHEAGHCKHRDILKEVVFGIFSSFVLFWIAYRSLLLFSSRFGFNSAADIAGFPLLSLVSLLYGLILMPLGNVFSRSLERAADDFALKITGMKSEFISAMKKLALLNLSDPNPHPLIEFLMYSHPSIAKRIKRAESFVQ